MMQIILDALAADPDDKKIKHQLSARAKEEKSFRDNLLNSDSPDPYTVNKIKESDDL